MRISYFESEVNPSHHLNRHLPPIGLRIVKTAVAVFICFLIHALRGYNSMVSESVITAILCIQSDTQDSVRAGFERVVGTCVGAVSGLALLVVLRSMPVDPHNTILVYAVISIGLIFAVYSTVVFKMPYASALAAITYVCILMSYPDISSPLSQTYERIFDTMLGVLVGVCVNAFHLPRTVKENQMFFVSFQDLVADRTENMSPAVLFNLKRLYDKGARICLMTHWAPGILIPQLSNMKVNVPMIVMGGAAMYDVRTNRYIRINEIDPSYTKVLTDKIRAMELGCSLLAIRENSLMIYHQGSLNEGEEKEYTLMRRSPYRNYFSGSYGPDDHIVGIQLLIPDKDFDHVYQMLVTPEISQLFNIYTSRPHGINGYQGIYFMDSKSTFENMKKHVMEYLHFAEHTDVITVVPDRKNFDAKYDAIRILKKIRKLYEPVSMAP